MVLTLTWLLMRGQSIGQVPVSGPLPPFARCFRSWYCHNGWSGADLEIGDNHNLPILSGQNDGSFPPNCGHKRRQCANPKPDRQFQPLFCQKLPFGNRPQSGHQGHYSFASRFSH